MVVSPGGKFLGYKRAVNRNHRTSIRIEQLFFCFHFLPVTQATREQFRRFANVYFLIIGIIMTVGQNTSYYATAMSPWTTMGPFAIVISVSLTAEGHADVKRHRSDQETNNAPCVILRRASEIDGDDNAERDTTIIGGKDVIVSLSKRPSSQTLSAPDDEQSKKGDHHYVQVAFQKIKRMNIRQGHLILIRNRDAVPADTVILATSGENGCAYIETSSIDGETNLKVRNSPKISPGVSKILKNGVSEKESYQREDDETKVFQSLEKATKNITRLSAIAYPDGIPASFAREDSSNKEFIATLTSEPPNSNVNTFSGKLVLPPKEEGGSSIEIPLDAENILLRGAILRNTEWVIGISCYTGNDTKLVRNSFQTPSKFSRIDVLINQCVILIITFMCICIGYLSVRSWFAMNERFGELW